MFKKLIPVILLVFVAACANVQGSSGNSMAAPCECCEKCECCKSGDCECCKDEQCSCCKNGDCSCCKDGVCKMCQGKMKGMASTKEDAKPCKICLEAEKASNSKKK